MSERCGKSHTEAEYDQMWTSADADGDGVVNLNEFTAFMKMMRQKMKDEKAQ